jgi:hypothetical protein
MGNDHWWWRGQNTLAILADAGMGPEDIVRLNVYSTDPDGLKYVRAHREKYLKAGHTPASTWVVVAALANPKWVVEMETVAEGVGPTTCGEGGGTLVGGRALSVWKLQTAQQLLVGRCLHSILLG